MRFGCYVAEKSTHMDFDALMYAKEMHLPRHCLFYTGKRINDIWTNMRGPRAIKSVAL